MVNCRIEGLGGTGREVVTQECMKGLLLNLMFIQIPLAHPPKNVGRNPMFSLHLSKHFPVLPHRLLQPGIVLVMTAIIAR